MKKLILSLSLLATTVLPVLSHAQSVQDNCDAVTNAAVAGRDQANRRIADLESAVQQQATRMRSCMEAFSDAASRQALVIGGFDLAPLRDRLMDQACSYLQGQVASAQQSITNQISSQLANVPSSVTNAIQQQTGITPQSVTSPQSRSVWDRISCRVSGSC